MLSQYGLLHITLVLLKIATGRRKESQIKKRGKGGGHIVSYVVYVFMIFMDFPTGSFVYKGISHSKTIS